MSGGSGGSGRKAGLELEAGKKAEEKKNWTGYVEDFASKSAR